MADNTIKGIVERTSKTKNGYGVMIDGHWYNDFGNCPVKEGDEVEVSFATKGDWRNIEEIKKIGETQKIIAEKKAYEGKPFNEELSIKMAARRNALSYVHNKLLAAQLQIEEFDLGKLTLKDYTDAIEKREIEKIKNEKENN